MHARLVLIALAVFAFSAQAQTPAGAWDVDPKTGCKVWSQYPDPAGESITWSGGCANGLAQGQGVLQWFVAGKPYARYEGGYRGGKMDGQGILRWVDGTRFDGAWQDDKPNGAGTKTTPSGQVYSGNWTNGCFKQGNRMAVANALFKECGFP
ncbi:MAG TPA: hypothetical protein VFC38_09065 [Stellaceae bacterium]|nr:hypothetical protein [Stellaceae bacterium]